MNIRLLMAACVLAAPSIIHAHGPGHQSMNSVLAQDVLDGDTPLPPAPDTQQPPASGKSFKNPIEPTEAKRWWGASLSTGWESRHIHYGVNETGNSGAYTNEMSVWVKDFSFGFWSGFGTGNSFQEYDFTASYNLKAGPVFFIPGYNFRYQPGQMEGDHHGEEHGGEEADAHIHNTYGHEIFAVLGTSAIPYVTPNIACIWDLNNTPGGFMEFRLDGEIPVYKDILTLQPYALLGWNFGYNTTAYYGWNNFQFGLEAVWKINRFVSVFGGVNYNVAMTALREINQGNEVWANAGITFSY